MVYKLLFLIVVVVISNACEIKTGRTINNGAFGWIYEVIEFTDCIDDDFGLKEFCNKEKAMYIYHHLLF